MSASAASNTLSLVSVIPGAVEQGDVVTVCDRHEEFGEAAGGVFGVVEFEVEVAQGEVGGNDVHGRVVGGTDVRIE